MVNTLSSPLCVFLHINFRAHGKSDDAEAAVLFSLSPLFSSGWLTWARECAVNKHISIRICIYTIILFLLLKIKYFALKVCIFINVLCFQNKESYFGLLFTMLSSVLSQLKIKDKGQIVALILLLACFLHLLCFFPLSPLWWIGWGKLYLSWNHNDLVSEPLLFKGTNTIWPLNIKLSPDCTAGRIWTGQVLWQSWMPGCKECLAPLLFCGEIISHTVWNFTSE